MSENFQLLQQLAQKPSARAWFMNAFSKVHLKITDTSEEFTLLNRGTHLEVTNGFHNPERKKDFLARLGFDPAGWYARGFIVPLQSENIRSLVAVFADDVVDAQEEYRIVSFLVLPLLKAALSVPVLRNRVMLTFLGIDPVWQQALIDPQGNETQQVTAQFTDNQWQITPGYQGQPKCRYLIKPEQFLAFQQKVHEVELQGTSSAWLSAMRWFWNWRNSMLVRP